MNATRLFFYSVAGFAGLLVTNASWAETWTDVTGKFRIEAEYVGVEGTSVVLRKEDGKTLSVPISRLSNESRTLAKSLYDMNKSGGAVPDVSAAPVAPALPAASVEPAMPDKSPVSAATAPAKGLHFTPPALPTIPPLEPFPENASLQETVDFVKTQLLAGHPEVFWFALPSEVRETIDADEFRNKLNPFMQEQAATSKQVEAVVMKAVEVLVTKKAFVLNSPLMGQVPPPLLPTVQAAYDPAVGLVYEISMLSFANVSLAERSITEMLDDHGPRIGAHLQALAKLAPPGTVDGFLSQVVVAETSDLAGTITVPNNEGGTESTEMVKLAGRWVPKDFAEKWESSKDGLIDSLVDSLNQAKQQSEATGQPPEAMVGMFAMVANSALDPMLAATTQAEFDQAIMGIMAMLPNMSGNVGPAGAEVELNLEIE